MTIIETRNFNDYINKATTYQGTFQTAQDKKSKFEKLFKLNCFEKI